MLHLEVGMTILGGLDIHRAQLTYDLVEWETGELHGGRIAPANRAQLRVWLMQFHGTPEVTFALESCTGWRYVVEELARAGVSAHVAELAETTALLGRKSRAKTDRAADLPDAARYAVNTGMRQIERLTAEMVRLRQRIVAIGSHQPGCQALERRHYGIGPRLSVAVWKSWATASGPPTPTTPSATPGLM
ncbi:MAG: hypothetical protein ACHQE5_10305 [Actinomycetes bacterium]